MAAEELCFCDLVALYALDILDEQERLLVEQSIADCSDLEAELADFQTAVAALAYSTPPIVPAPDLKQRLFDRIGVELPPPLASRPRPRIDMPDLVVRASELNWEPYRIPGVTVAQLHVNPARREVVAVLKAEPGVTYPLHRHAGVEEIYMLEGDLTIEGQVYGPGDYIRSEKGSIHGPATSQGCMFFIRTRMDDEYDLAALTGVR
ncbi:anti-sigma factor [Leptolyngbya sp. 'hensonii']|uniref:cupin domain-containing protein n=1 Tax=Leptolyngbya sp. 'hensonii' TaxID=1922337 RepID=UPI00094FA9E1|nr:cupin domain-containing protein [Leptolyngbya sp. 'hensonii']OLP18814.1 anti-sigma factor [Leptolyngbya sp. 'hensonii']